MTIDSLEKKIDDTVELVFVCNFNEVIKNTVEIVEYVEKNVEFSNEENKESWKQIAYYLTLGLENRDYLVIGDIMKYELKTLLRKEKLS